MLERRASIDAHWHRRSMPASSSWMTDTSTSLIRCSHQRCTKTWDRTTAAIFIDGSPVPRATALERGHHLVTVGERSRRARRREP